ncbi:MAG TPA: histidine--tRNA ligase [Bacteroidales bacterium]|nr:histidine--tRNA ligase [Bacteroidales bacterium]
MNNPVVTIPKGTRDFSPEEMTKRNYIFDTIKSVFKQFGYLQIETPAMETLDVLLGKYGEEGDKLLFRVLNSGDFMSKVNDKKNISSEHIANLICEKGLRYDLTVPFARYVVQHKNDIIFPFRRFQIQPVWRADKPQKGRYREFYQCDADIIGSNSIINEFELLQMTDLIFAKLGINISIHINNRKILSGITYLLNKPELLTMITTIIDKTDKIGHAKVIDELLAKGIDKQSINTIEQIIYLKGSNEEKLTALKNIFKNCDEALKGIEEVEELFNYIKNIGLSSSVSFDLSLARGLNYYTGIIIEVKAKDVSIGSISGGGRYDNLTGIFGLSGISGVGISYGADRIVDVMKELSLFPRQTQHSIQVMFVNFGKKEELYCLKQANKLRNMGINCEIYPENVKIKKQMAYANNRKIPYVVLIGENEMAAKDGKFTVKEMNSGKEIKSTLNELYLKILQLPE